MLFALERKSNSNDESESSITTQIKDTHPVGNVSYLPRHNDDKVLVRIGNEAKSFKIDSLKQLTYFEVLFTDRWMKQQKGSTADNSICIFDDIDNSPFTLDDIALLLKCIKLGHIPTKSVLNLGQIESLLNCCDFLCANKKASIIDENKLLRYIQCRKPAITARQRQEWIVESNNKLLRKVLTKYDNLLMKQLTTARETAIAIGQRIDTTKQKTKEMTKIMYDSDTAATIFKRRFKIKADTRMHDGKMCLMIEIDNFHKELWTHLEKLFIVTDYWHYFGNEISNLVEKLGNWDCDNNIDVICKHEEDEALTLVLWNLLHYLTRKSDYNYDEDPSVPENISVFSVVMAQFNLCHGQSLRFKNLDCCASCFSYLTPKENGMLLANLAKTHRKYQSFCGLKSWYQTFRCLLARCDEKFLVSKAKLWFPITCQACVENVKSGEKEKEKEKEKSKLKDQVESDTDTEKLLSKDEWAQFVFDKVLCKLGTQASFDFGLYLVDYIMYNHDSDKGEGINCGLDKKYMQFLRDYVGIKWDVL